MVWYAVYDTQKYSTKQSLNSSSSSNKLQLNFYSLTHDDPAVKMVPLSSSAAGNGAYR
jgi:hypothetical protein